MDEGKRIVQTAAGFHRLAAFLALSHIPPSGIKTDGHLGGIGLYTIDGKFLVGNLDRYGTSFAVKCSKACNGKQETEA